MSKESERREKRQAEQIQRLEKRLKELETWRETMCWQLAAERVNTPDTDLEKVS
jgi:hypothetical protein